MSRPYRDSPARSNTDLEDYFDTIPPAHRLSSIGTTTTHSVYSTNDIPMGSRSPNYGSQPVAMRSSTQMNTYHDSADQDGHFADNEPKAQWAEKGASKKNTKSKWLVLGGALGLLCLIGVGVALGVTLSKKSSSTSTSASSSNSSTSDDPSVFDKDDNLHLSFYGIAYTPAGSQLPDCGNSLDDVIKDIQIMSQLTTRVRLYGADCNQSALVLEAIQQTKVNMTVYLGNYPVSTDDDEAYERQRDLIQDAIETYGTDHIAGVTVGNEYILNYLNANGGTDANDAVGDAGAALLIANINDTRSMLDNLGVDIQVGNADAGSYFNDLVVQQIDYGMANVHPWFANVSVDQAAGWTWQFFQWNDVELAAQFSNNPDMSIAETGWPTKSSDEGNANNGPSLASVDNLNTFLDTFVCQANDNGTAYFFFEFFDEEWKDETYGGVEGWWGLFNANRTLKDGITIPNCVLS